MSALGSLGERLVQNRELVGAQGGPTGSAAQMNHALVRAFFEEMRKRIEEAIENEDPKIAIDIGFNGSNRAFGEVSELLKNRAYGQSAIKALENERHPYHRLWTEFQAWACANDLAVSLVAQHDGGGVHDWIELTCEPSPEVQRRRPEVERG